MNAGLARGSLFLLALSIFFLIALTVFESALTGMSMMVERVVTFLLLILPSAAGAVLGILSLVRREGRAWFATLSVVLNTLFALCHTALMLFAG